METNTHSIVYMLDNTGKIVFINDEIQQYGYSPQELIGKNIMDIFLTHNRKKTNGTLKRETNTYGVWLITKNKTAVPMEIQSRRIENIQITSVSSEEYYVSTMPAVTVCNAKDISQYRSPYLLAMNKNIDKKLKITHQENNMEKTSPRGGYWEDIKENINKILHENIADVSPHECDDEFLKEYFELVKE